MDDRVANDNEVYDEEHPLEKRRSAASVIRRAFADRGVELPDHDSNGLGGYLRNLAAMCNYIFDDYKFQETGGTDSGSPNTREPVERVLKAVEQLGTALADCWEISEHWVRADRINVAEEFRLRLFNNLSEAEQAEWYLNSILPLYEAARKSLDSGAKRAAAAPPLLAYDEFVSSLIRLCKESGLPIEFRGKGTYFTGSFIELAQECEVILPPELRAVDTKKVAIRIAAAIKRMQAEPMDPFGRFKPDYTTDIIEPGPLTEIKSGFFLT